ncbi:MAG: exodeoxyribonuclease large subunit [Pseudomonadota bacterium]
MNSNDSPLIPEHLLRSNPNPTPLSVSQLNRAAKQLLESEFLQVYVEGEISNFSRPSSGHWYFSLKDDNAQIRCAFFKGKNLYCQVPAQNGVKVAVKGKISLYEARGEYQLIVEHMEDAGVGALQVRFEALKKQLHGEGLFDPERKRDLPTHPKRIAIITSPTGAAVRDMLSVFARRYAQLQIDVVPVMVQGDQAAPQIVAALQWVGELGMHDAIVVARGGGSIEDLWAFNEERVARAIAASPIPVVSAVGHETDFTIADFVADKRVPTPSAAAEILSPDSQQHIAKLEQLHRRLASAVGRAIANRQRVLQSVRRTLRHPSSQIQQWNQRLDDIENRLWQSQRRFIREHRTSLRHHQWRLHSLSPQRLLTNTHKQLDGLYETLVQLTRRQLGEARQQLATQQSSVKRVITQELQQARLRLAHSGQMLNNLSPLNVLYRGYALARNEQQQLIKSVHSTGIGQKIEVQLHDGSLSATVITTSPNTDK